MGASNLLRQANSILNLELESRLGLEKGVRELKSRESIYGLSAAQWHWMCLSSGLFSHALETLDKVSSRLGVEIRFPFFDRRLIEFCLALPVRFKLARGWDRFILRQFMAKHLPKSVSRRVQKANLSANFNSGLWPRQASLIEETLLHNRETLEQLCGPGAARQAYRTLRSDPLGNHRAALDLYLAIILARWLDTSGLEIR